MKHIAFAPTFSDFKTAAKAALNARYAPNTVHLQSTDEPQAGLFDAPEQLAAAAQPILRLPKSFVEGAQYIAVHRHADRWNLLYRLLWRIAGQEPQVMHRAHDADVIFFARLIKEVRQDVQNCHAYVRFRPVDDANARGGKHYVAWYEPDYPCLPLAAAHFVERFAATDWSILTPDASVTWQGDQLAFGPGASRDESLGPDDAIEALWSTYYTHIFNPARLNMKATKQNMPQRFWKNMPETQLIEPLRRGAGVQTDAFMAEQKPLPVARKGYPTLEALAQDVRGCEICPWAAQATQGVPGEGAAGRRLMVVGEQPGDMEDLAGKPFVGPAGQLFAKALHAAGITREEAYITNAVKHFKFEPRGKRRIHQKPTAADVGACKSYLAAEWALVKPKVLLCLGTTAALAVFGKAVKLKDVRAAVHKTQACAQTFVTTHPSAILRMPPEAQEGAMAQFIADLSEVRRLVDAA